MANIKSAKKRILVTKKKTMRNRMIKSRAKNAVKKYRRALAEDMSTAEQQLSAASSALDRAVSKGVMHRNTANRNKSRMAKALNKAMAAQQ
ncbi:MAG: 30S ribosomal protein S20 [Christensenellaceae bacterium]|nr:30S ribosomal protein S20 [Christensenellaceae bacterium]